MRKSMIEKIKAIQKIADKDCYCDLKDAESEPYPDCDNCEIHKASSLLNEISLSIYNYSRVD